MDPLALAVALSVGSAVLFGALHARQRLAER